MLFAIFITHRMIGPIVPIRQQISQLREGKYGIHRQLRSKDELGQIVEDLNDLSDYLQQQHGAETE